VFPDERHGFARQLDYLRNFGEFITLDHAVSILESGQPINGRYFCLTFDDGISCCHDHALPILAGRGIPATFFIVTDYTADDPVKRIRCPLHADVTYAYEYLTWPECRKMIAAGMTIGSHTRSHVRLSRLPADKVRLQLVESKQTIEEKLGIECRHFSCPWGGSGNDFDPRRDLAIAKAAGYRTFLTTHRGMNTSGYSPFAIRRDNIYANWGNFQLRYFLSRETLRND
jgi:peptidoglycan/xylan/chitin deacetylase (PgdA/CDA1 family)